MPRPGLSVDRAFNEVRKAVQAETGTQRPESNRNDLSNPDAAVLVARLPDLAQGVDQQTLREREASAAWAIIEGAQGDALFKMDLIDRFMRTFQDTSYFALAAQKKLDLDTAEVARLEAIRADEAWSAAKESGVLAPLQAFIEAYPDSPHLAEARRRIAMLHLFDSADERALPRSREKRPWRPLGPPDWTPLRSSGSCEDAPMPLFY